jgi:hypothetical protein
MLTGIKLQNSEDSSNARPFKVLENANVHAFSRRDTVKSAPKTTGWNQQVVKVNATDTSSTIVYKDILPFELSRSVTDEQYNQNFLLAISGKDLCQHLDVALKARKPVVVKINPVVTTKVVAVKARDYIDGTLRAETSMNWLPMILILSLFVFSWVKMAYQKYVVQVMASTFNYQISVRLLRERNVLFRNMALGLNFVFAVNIGLFIYMGFQIYGFQQVNQSEFLSVLLYSLGVLILSNIKTFFCKLLGFFFQVQEEFSEYVHNLNLFNKNAGLFLFPFVLLYPYVDDKVKPFIFYAGCFVLLAMALLSIYRGGQIIVRKGVSLFYLIVYLCAVEILPALLLVKISSTLL